MTECRSCGARITFVETAAGKWIPVDPDYVSAQSCKPGSKLVADDGEVFTVTAESTRSERGRVPHWATCDNPGRFRR